MTEKPNSQDSSAPTIEEAIENGLNRLGLSRDQAVIEVIDQGSKGILGLGAKNAVVRLTPKVVEKVSVEDPAQPAPAADSPVDPKLFETESAPESMVAPPTDSIPGDDNYVLELTLETVEDLLDKMKVDATIKTSFGHPDNQRRPAIQVDISGDDLSVLIGPRAETLNALQYITRLIVGKKLGRSVMLHVDVAGYRERRENSLRKLARRMAKQAKSTGKRQQLEPMSAAERRIIHIELRDDLEISTESIGEGKQRKVTIIPQR